MSTSLSSPSGIPSLSHRPHSVDAAVALIWTQVLVGVVSATVYLADRSAGGSDDSIATLLVGQAVSVGLPAVMSVPMARGKRWAQAVVLGLAALGALLRLVGLGDDPFIPLGLFQVASVGLNLGIIGALLTPSARVFFTRGRGVASRTT